MTNTYPDRQGLRELLAETSGSLPSAIPPHPPLVSGGWYHGMSLDEVLGPGRYPVEDPKERSVGTAVLLTLLFGPVGLIYVSVTGGLVCTALTTLALALLGFQPLLVAWPITVLCAWILASGTQREFQDRTIR